MVNPAVPQAGGLRWSQRARRAWHSLGLRIVALFVLLALAIVLIGAGGIQRAMGGGWRGLIRPLVADYMDRLVAEIGTPPDVERARSLVQRLPLSVRISGPIVQWDSRAEAGGRTAAGASPARSDEPSLGDAQRAAPLPPRREGSSPVRHRPPWWDGDADPPAPGDTERGWLMLARHTSDGHLVQIGLGDVPWRHRPRSIGWLTLGLLALLTGVAYAVVRRWLQPLRDVRAGVQRFGQGQFATPIEVRRADELGDLATQINTMAARLEGMLDAKRALLLAISHELRSPLTRARLNAELVDEGPERQALLRDLAEMRELIDDLLESERLAAGHRALQRETIDLAGLVRQVCVELRQAAEAGAAAKSASVPELDLHLEPGFEAMSVDPARWRVLVRNLVGNALRHGRAADGTSRVEVRLQVVDGESRLTVRDQGPGVPPEQMAQLAEAFYRPDAARGRHSGGVGLGLYLCRLIAQAHRGRLELTAAHPGLLATVTWPRTD